MLDALRKRNNLLPFLVCTGGLLACIPLYPIHPGLFILGMVLTAFFTYLELVTQMAFRTPARRKEPVDDDDWTVHDIESDGVRMRVPSPRTAISTNLDDVPWLDCWINTVGSKGSIVLKTRVVSDSH